LNQTGAIFSSSDIYEFFRKLIQVLSFGKIKNILTLQVFCQYKLSELNVN